MQHRLDPLLRPRSVAVVGASARVDSLGEWSLRNLLRGEYPGKVYPVNPNYEELQGVVCYASLAELPAVPDLVIFGVGDHRIEAALDEAIALGIGAAVIMSTLVIDDDESPDLRARIQKKIDDAGMLVCGANGMGFYNIRDHVWACGFDSADHVAPGHISLISHSGAGMSGLVDCEQRLRVNIAVSTGNELSVTMDQYLDFVLDLPETRVVGLFIETARNPEGLIAAFEKAAQRQIPIVALKVGRTEEAARLTVSHSGAMAGDDSTFEALFDRYGVQRVRDMDQLATTLIMFAGLHPLGTGGLVTLHDSGGERQLMVDLADETGVPLTKLRPETVAALEKVLDPELPAVNPLDAWSRGGPGAREQQAHCLSLMLQDPGAALGAAILNRAPYGKVYPSYLEYMKSAHEESGKPVALASARQGSGHDQLAVTGTDAGFPVLDGVVQFLLGVRALFAYRDFLQQPASDYVPANATATSQWTSRLASGETLGEAESLAMLGDFELPAAEPRVVDTESALLEVAAEFDYPLVLKTAMPGVLHKSELNGVVLNIENDAELRAAYKDMVARLGATVLLAPMVDDGVEMILGVRRDPQFGPVILLGFGGVMAEVTHDVAFALSPFDAAHARRCVDRLTLRALLDGVRGKPKADIDAFCDMAAKFSSMVFALGDIVNEVDVNPIMVHESGCVAVDALVVGRNIASR
jgi:acyl-CoA synthetase (NDP forming)